jgi:dTDP-4-dehydrorhamnose reductase
MQINGIAPAVMAEEAKRLGAALVSYSTDYVFDGAKADGYGEDDAPHPLNVYGRSKLAGDQGIAAAGGGYLIFRTSWVYGSRGRNFLLTMLKLGAERAELKVVDDQIGAPTWSRTIAEITAQVVALLLSPAGLSRVRPSLAETFAERGGLYNLTSAGSTSWYGFAQRILSRRASRAGGKCAKLLPIPSSHYAVKARRPANSVLNNRKLNETFGLRPPAWEHSLELVMDEVELRG